MILSISKGSLLLNDLPACIHLMNLYRYIFYAFLPPGSASLHADPDPGGLFKCGSVQSRIRIRNTAFKY